MVDNINFPEKYGPWALVVGASAGLGAAWADECAKRGLNVIICARRMDKLTEVAADLREKYGVETKQFVIDISQEGAADDIIEQIIDLDIGMCIYNAAVEHAGYFIRTSDEDHMRLITANAINPMRLSHYLCREMARNHRGCIMLCGSMSGIIGTAGQSVYGACKAFMVQLGETLWYEMRKFGVEVAGITIGSVVTPEFIRVQAASGTNMEANQSYDISEMIGDLQLDPAIFGAQPHTPEEVAAYVMSNIGTGPRLFSHPQDEISYYGFNRMTRKDGCLFMGRMTDRYFSAGYELVGDVFEELPEFKN